MIDQWREILYPLGFLSSLAFMGRFLLQWLSSETQHKSVVPRAFWHLSLAGNLMLMIHSSIQLQYHVCVIQACNAVISWRNLNLMQPIEKQFRFKSIVGFFGLSIIVVTFFFLIQDSLATGGIEWFRAPAKKGPAEAPLHDLWHFVGFAGLILFSSRFWVQWWCAEKSKTSYLGPAFWWLSLIGDIFCLVYFARIFDPVNLIGFVFGLVPYIRNLMLIYKAKNIYPSESKL